VGPVLTDTRQETEGDENAIQDRFKDLLMNIDSLHTSEDEDMEEDVKLKIKQEDKTGC